MDKQNELIQMATDLITVPTGQVILQGYSNQDVEESLRAELRTLAGMSEGNKGVNYAKFRENKNKIFAIVEEVLDTHINEGLTSALDGFADYKNVDNGEKMEFVMPANSKFKVSVISDGNGNLRRQRMAEGSRFSVPTETYGVKVYDELVRFLTGRVDWNEMVNAVADAMDREVVNQINEQVVATFGKAITQDSTYRLNKSGGVPTEQEILRMAQHIQAATNEQVTIVGTPVALSQLRVQTPGDADNHERTINGYYGTVAGLPAQAVQQAHVSGTEEFVFDDNTILLLPQTRDRMVKVVNEGPAIVRESRESRDDLQDEYLFIKRFGVALVPSSVYGVINFANA